MKNGTHVLLRTYQTYHTYTIRRGRRRRRRRRKKKKKMCVMCHLLEAFISMALLGSPHPSRQEEENRVLGCGDSFTVPSKECLRPYDTESSSFYRTPPARE